MMSGANNTHGNDEFHKLLLVVKDLAQQLDENRQATAKLKLHADLLKVIYIYIHLDCFSLMRKS